MTTELWEQIATPSRLGVHISKEFMGVQYVPYPWILRVEQRVLDAIADPEERFIILNVPPQNGKGETDSTPLPTPSGWTKMGDLRVGDSLFGRNGQPCRVTGVFPQPLQAIFRVHFTDRTTLDVTDDHLWWVRDRRRQVSRTPRHYWEGVVATADLRTEIDMPDGHKRWGVPLCGALQLPEAELPLDPWVLGYWLGNGTRGAGAMAAHEEDGDYVVGRVRAAGFSTSSNNPTERQCRVVRPLGMSQVLKGLQVRDRKHIPMAYLRSSERQRRDLLAGLLDSDGYCGGPMGQIELCFTDKTLADDCEELVRSLGRKPRRTEGEAAYTLNGVRKITGTRHRLFWVEDECPMRSPRKRAMFKPSPSKKGDRLKWRYVERIEVLDPEPSRCITVDSPDSLFVAGKDLIVSHNTTTFGMLLSAWYLGMFPSHQVIFVAYAAEYAETWGLKTRSLMSKYGKKLFGVGVSNAQSSAGNWKTDNGFGGMMSVGILGGITGNPGNLIICLTGDAVVETSEGPMRLDAMFRRGYDGLDVLSFNHHTEHPEFRPIINAQRTSRSDIVEIRTTGGRSLRCTSDHPVWVEGLGYREAQLLQPGWRVRCLPDMRQGDQQKGQPKVLLGLLPNATREPGRVLLRCLRSISGGNRRRPSQTQIPDMRDHLHGQKDPRRSRPVGASADVSVWGARQEGATVLLARMSDEMGQDPQDFGRQDLPAMLSAVRPGQRADGVLLAGVRRRGALGAHDGQSQQPLQGRDQLHPRVLGGAPKDHPHGWRGVRGLQDIIASLVHPPHRPQPAEQLDGQPDHTLPPMPHETPQVGFDTVSVVRRPHGETVDVYDITVEETRNFFANGILVHNCDDVIKTMEEASSITAKAKHIAEFDGSITSRFQMGTTVIVTATRFADDDLSGRLIERMDKAGYAGDKWEVISIPALAEPPEELELEPDELAEWVDFLGRHQGEVLEGRYSQKFYENRRATMDPFSWSAVYQQRPSVMEGGMFPRGNWQFWNPQTIPPITRTVRVWDLAATAGGGDWTVGAKFGLGANGDLYLMERERFQRNSADVERAVLAAAAKDGYETKILIEQEKAGAGKREVDRYQRLMPGFFVDAAKIDGSKEVRARAYSGMQHNKRVWLPELDPVLCKEWMDEHRRMMGDGRRPRHDDQCLVGETMVRTPNGDRRLDSIREGDTVLGSNGWTSVVRAGQTGFGPVVEAAGIVGTANHPVWTTGGWTALGDLNGEDKIAAFYPPSTLLPTWSLCLAGDMRPNTPTQGGHGIANARDDMGSVPVYNLTTTDGTFFANGILVHNCDTGAYATLELVGIGGSSMWIPGEEPDDPADELVLAVSEDVGGLGGEPVTAGPFTFG